MTMKRPIVALHSVTIVYSLCCRSTFLSKSKSANRECCMVNLFSGSLNEGQLNKNNERSHFTTE